MNMIGDRVLIKGWHLRPWLRDRAILEVYHEIERYMMDYKLTDIHMWVDRVRHNGCKYSRYEWRASICDSQCG